MFGDGQWSNMRSALIGAVVAAVVLLTFPAVAAVGSNLILGQANSADAITSLSGAAAANLRITNTQAGSPALDLRVVSGSAPLKVDSTARIPNLNADRLDGKHGGAYALAAHTHDAAAVVSGTLDTGRYSSYADLGAEGYLDDSGTGDLLTQAQGDSRYLGSEPDTLLYVPGNALELADPGLGEAGVFFTGPNALIWRLSSAGHVDVTLPITLPAQQSGRWIKLVNFRVYYTTTSGQYIDNTLLYKLDGTGVGVLLAGDGTDYSSTSPSNYFGSCDVSDCALSWPSGGFISLDLRLQFGSAGFGNHIVITGFLLRYSYD